MKLSQCALGFAFLCLAACQRSNQEDPVARPLAGTGLVAADLAGSWRVTTVELSEHETFGPPTGEGNERDPFCGLLSVAPGAVLEFADGEVVGTDACELRLDAAVRRHDTSLRRYLNQVDDRFARFARHHDSRSPHIADGGTAVLELAFGTVDRDHLLGVIYYRASGFAPADAIRLHLARVTLTREP